MRWGGRGAALFACGLRARRGRTWQPGAAQVKPACLARVFRSGCIAAVVVLSLTTPLVAQGIDIERCVAADVCAAGIAASRAGRQPSRCRSDRARRPPVRRQASVGGRRPRLRDVPSAGQGLHRRPPAGARPLRSPLATQHARPVELGVGQALLLGRTRLLARGAGRHADRGGAGDGRRLADDSAAAREGSRPCRSAPGGTHGGARRIAGRCRRGARRLRALPGVAADPLRCLGRRRQHRAAPRRGARLPTVHRQGRLRAVSRGMALHRRPLPRYRPARAATAAGAPCRAARRA